MKLGGRLRCSADRRTSGSVTPAPTQSSPVAERGSDTTRWFTHRMVAPLPEPGPIDPDEPVPDDPAELLPDAPEPLPPPPIEATPDDPGGDPGGVPEPA